VAHYLATIDVPVPAAEAFDYLAEFSTTQEWDPGVETAEMVTALPVALGSRFHLVTKVAGRAVPLGYEIIAYDRPNRVTVRAENASTISEDTITFTEVAGPDGSSDPHTSVRYEAGLELKGAYRVLTPVIGLMFQRIGDRAAAGLRATLLDRAGRPS